MFSVFLLVFGSFVLLVTTLMLALRGTFTLGPLMGGTLADPLPAWSAGAHLVHGTLEVLYTAVVALPCGIILVRTDRWWSFHPLKAAAGRR